MRPEESRGRGGGEPESPLQFPGIRSKFPSLLPKLTLTANWLEKQRFYFSMKRFISFLSPHVKQEGRTVSGTAWKCWQKLGSLFSKILIKSVSPSHFCPLKHCSWLGAVSSKGQSIARLKTCTLEPV